VFIILEAACAVSPQDEQHKYDIEAERHRNCTETHTVSGTAYLDISQCSDWG